MFSTIRPNGVLTINAGAMTIQQMHETTHACLLWDPDTRRLAIRPSLSATSAFTLSRGRSHAYISAQRLWGHIGLPLDTKSKRLAATWNETEGLLEVHLP